MLVKNNSRRIFSRLTLTGNMLMAIARIRNTDIHTPVSTSSPIFQFKNVLPSSYLNLIVFETATSSSAARMAYANLSSFSLDTKTLL